MNSQSMYSCIEHYIFLVLYQEKNFIRLINPFL